jgi:hypothetical protein
MTIAESLRYWLGFRLCMWAANRLYEIAKRNAPPGAPPPPKPTLRLVPPPADESPPQQPEFMWV